MEIDPKIKALNRELEPFYLVDHENGQYSLCLAFSFLEGPRYGYGQEAFNEYARSIGDPVLKDGFFTHGSGYEWEYAFRKAFENDPNIGRIQYDSEAGGFFVYGDNLKMMEDFGRRFKSICEDEPAFTTLVCKAIPEGEAKMAEWEAFRHTVRGFLADHPNATVDILSQDGFICITPNAEPSSPNGLSLDDVLDHQVRSVTQHRNDTDHYIMLAEPAEEPVESDLQEFLQEM